MKVKITPSRLHGSIRAIASKSQAHRLLICAAFADRPTDIECRELSRDIEATAGCLKSMGSGISYDVVSGIYHVIPVRRDTAVAALKQGNAEAGAVIIDNASGKAASDDACGAVTIDVGESGSTLRFLLPVVCALGLNTHIVMHGRLPERPLSPLWEEIEAHGCKLTKNSDGSVDTCGRLTAGTYTIAANISSQFISGLLFAFPLIDGECRLRLTGSVESRNYILMTIAALKEFGVEVDWDADLMRMPVCSGFKSPGYTNVEGDWSNGAFWVCAGRMSGDGIDISGLRDDSGQGDKAVIKLRDTITAGRIPAGRLPDGRNISEKSAADKDTASVTVDARDVPDLVPVLSVLAASAAGETVFTHAERLRIKESDRIKSTVGLIRALGGTAEETDDGLRVEGTGRLHGGTVDSCNDHRVAMSAAVASIICDSPVIIERAEAVRKSYPDFWTDFERLGGNVTVLED